MKINAIRNEKPAEIQDKQYKFTVVNAEDTVSKAGNEMIKLMLSVVINGQPRVVYDYLAIEWKLREFLASVGRSDLLNGDDPEVNAKDCVDLSGECTLKEEEFNGKIQLKVGKYIRADFQTGDAAITEIKSTLSAPKQAEAEDSDFDDLPF